jgi:hypothetical protein
MVFKMPKTRRIIISTSSGLLFAIVCLALSTLSPASGALTWAIAVQLILSRTLIGLAIGISCLSLWHWSLHGPLIGFVFSLPLAFSGLEVPEHLEYDKTIMFIATLITGMVYGFLIEIITSVIFKAKNYN